MIVSGIDVVYHSLRLGEGQTTCFRPEERKATLAAVRDSDLKLAHLVEPVGPEHTDDEIADVAHDGTFQWRGLERRDGPHQRQGYAL